MNSPAMPSAVEQAFQYFQARRLNFWQWAEGGEIVEWQDGSTICYRQELEAVLTALAPAGLPPLGAVLLLLAACSDSWPESLGRGVLQVVASQISGSGSKDELDFYLNQTLRFMDIVQGLPKEMRTGPRKLHLFREVFEPATSKKATAALAVVLDVVQVRSQQSLDEWTSGRLDAALQTLAGVTTRPDLLADLLYLDRAFQRFPSTDMLALRLRTGLDQVPAPMPALESPSAQPPEEAADLLGQLAQDVRTAGVARLAHQLVAALRIPLHMQEASEQPLGGITDVTNRGTFDRLLLSELAHDDITLMARLVNNEALYLRREAPPHRQMRPRTILLDTTLRLWGVPRVFALAASLAWIRNSGQERYPAQTVAYALGGQSVELLDLESLAGVIDALSRLDVALHSGAALRTFTQDAASVSDADCLLITATELLLDASFAAALADAKVSLRFLLTVSRSGELQLYEFRKGHRHLLSATRVDLDGLLFTPPPPRQPQTPLTPTTGPAFLQQCPAPLFFPTTGLRISAKNTFCHAVLGVFGITDTQRLLYWPDRNSGARELLSSIDRGVYHFGSNQTTHIYLLVSGVGVLRVYLLAATELQVESIDLLGELTQSKEPTQVVFKEGCFYVRRGGSNVVFDCEQGQVTGRALPPLPELSRTAIKPDFGQIKRHINNGYTTLQRVRRIGINRGGELVVEGRAIRLVSKNLGLVDNITPKGEDALLAVTAHYVEETALIPNTLVRFHRFRWDDGSEAVVDARGLLHLHSSDTTLPDLTVVLILGRVLAAWAANGTVCGPTYFTGSTSHIVLPAEEFYRQYLQRFIATVT